MEKVKRNNGVKHMGYRQYFYEVDKSKVDGIRRCKTEEELYKFCVTNGIQCDKDDYDGEISYYMPIYKLGKTIFEFGKYYENSSEIYKHCDSLFTSNELNERYEDYGAIICDENAILCAIQWQKQHIITMYENLVNNTFENSYERYEYLTEIDDKELHYQRLLRHCKDHLRWWKPGFGGYTAVNLHKEEEALAESWMYEHTIFDLVRIYKTFDWENKCLLFCGW
jgi:hypothetical protein